MATNDEIREQEDIQMAHYKSLTPDEQADRERSLMNKARADERSKVLEECEYRLHQEIMQAFAQAMANIDYAIFRQIHNLKNNENERED